MYTERAGNERPTVEEPFEDRVSLSVSSRLAEHIVAQTQSIATSKAAANSTVPTLLDIEAPALKSGAVVFPVDELVGLMQKLVLLPLDARLVFAGLQTIAIAVSGDVATAAKVPLIVPVSQPNGVHASTEVPSRFLSSHSEKMP